MAKKETFPGTHSGKPFIKDEHLYDFGVFTIPSYTSAPDGGLGGESVGGAYARAGTSWPLTGVPYIPSIMPMPPKEPSPGYLTKSPSGDKYLPVLERIATALEAIVERFC